MGDERSVDISRLSPAGKFRINNLLYRLEEYHRYGTERVAADYAEALTEFVDYIATLEKKRAPTLWGRIKDAFR